ncbi:MAG: O-antigen ligase domain-containing protein [Saprospiraceae bacterium]|nr:MAG: O-antigen ligase domain-containing protein [Saprospiraceae bacterium]
MVKTPGLIGLKEWLLRQVLFEKLNNPLGYGLMLICALGLALGLSFLSLKGAVIVVGVLVGIPLLVACFVHLYFGINVMLVSAFFIGLVSKYTDAPIGTALDGLLVVLLAGLLAKLVLERDFSFAKSPISLFILVWIGYNLLEGMNPWAASRMAWIYTVRTVALMLALYFIACHALNSYHRIVNTLNVILVLSFVSALYALKQEFIGFSDAEITWLNADEERFMLIFQWSRLRVFSFFSDPTTFGILMGYMSLFAFVLASGPFRKSRKAALVVAGIAMVMCMAYAGSRTPFVLIPAGILFITILTLKKRTILLTLFILLAGTAFVMKSTNNAVIWRIQSAFRGDSDDTIEVRMQNQKRVRPYIQTHPFGAGLGSTGYWGQRFSPGSWLSSFAHDSLYVRLAVETGWVGLLLYLMLLFTALRTSMRYYFRVKDPTIKVIYLGLSTSVFLLALASYPQEAITLLPTSIIFYIMLAMIARLKDFDENFREDAVRRG